MLRILHASRGLEATSGIATFIVESCNSLVGGGNKVGIVYQRLFEHKVNEKIQVIKEEDLNRIDWMPDVVHIHALWTLFSVRIIRWCIKNNVPFVVSPHGCLMPRVLKKGRLKKWIFLNLLLKPMLKRAVGWHCTCEAEIEACKAIGFDGPYSIVPLGCNLPLVYNDGERQDVVLFLGRVSEEKGLRLLLDAWNKIKHKGWVLRIVGPDWFGERLVLEKKVQDEAISDVCFLGVADSILKDKLYREAKVFVLPSPMENFSAVVLEALSYGMPVIATKGTPWKELESNHCGWWIEPGVGPLRIALDAAIMLSDEERSKMGYRSRVLAKGYSWDSVAEALIRLYRSCIVHK